MSTETIETFTEIGTPVNPFPGLRPFEFDESYLFFGRDGQSEQLISKLGRTRFLAVVGSSGSGKSSLVRAGFIPALLGGFMTSAGSGWRIAIMRPGNDPVGNLSQALNAPDVFGSEIEENAAIQIAIAEATLRRGNLGLVDIVRQAAMPANENLLVLVDQFEEIFRFARVSEGETYHNDAAAFVKLILEASRQREIPIYVVLTMRSDYLGDCSQFWDLPEAINESQYLVPRLTRDQLREAITGPAAVGLGKITPRLVNRLLNDVGDNQDQLPILQHALMRSWDEWGIKNHDHQEQTDGDALDLCCYESIGGMAEALSRHADEAFNQLPDDRTREVAGKLFKCLTEKGADNREIRRPTMLGEIYAVADATDVEVITVIETFRQPGRSFLMPPESVELNSQSLIDISHESLIRGWARLKNWVEEEARSARIYRRLAETAELHDEGKAGLWGDPDLQLALDWQEKNKPNRDWARRYHLNFATALAFLNASETKRASDTAIREGQQREEIERAKRELAQAQALAEAEQRRAEAERQKAEEQQQRLDEKTRAASRLRRLIAALVIAGVLAMAAVIAALFLIRIANLRRAEATEAQAQAVRAKADAQARFEEAEQNKGIAFLKTNEAKKLADDVETQRRSAEKLGKQAELATLDAQHQHQVAVEQQAKADQKEKLTHRLIYVANMKLAQQAYAENDLSRLKEVLDVNLPSPVGTAQDDLRGFEWYHFSHLYHKEPATLKEHLSYVTAVAFSPDGRTLVAGGEKTVTLWDTDPLGNAASLEVEPNTYHAVAFARDGTMATLSGGKVILRDPKGGKKAEFPVPRSSYPSLAFSSDGKFLAVAGGETVRLWDTANKHELTPLQTSCNSVAFSPDGETLAVRDGDSVKLWNPRTWTQLPAAPLKVEPTVKNAMTFSPDGGILAVADGAVVKLWDTKTFTETALEANRTAVLCVAFSPDGKTLATGDAGNMAKLWDVGTGKEVPAIMRHSKYVFSVAFSPDGKRLATGSIDKTVKVWDISWRQDQLPLNQSDVVFAVAFSPDGKILATGTDDNLVKLWDTSTRRELKTLTGHNQRVWAVAFSPDGRTLATGSEDKTVRLWDTTTWQEKKSLEHKSLVKSLAFSPDGGVLAVCSEYDSLTLWDTKTGTKLPGLKGDSQYALFVAFSRDGMLATAGRSLKLWDMSTRQEKVLDDSGSPVAFSPDGKTLASITVKGTIRLWDVKTREPLRELRGHSKTVTSLAFSSDGKTLVTGSYDDTVKLWDTQTGQELATLKVGSIVESVAFSRDGKMLAIGVFDHTARLWYAATDREVEELKKETSDKNSPDTTK